MHGPPLTPLERLSMLVVAGLWLLFGGGLAYVATSGFTTLPSGHRSFGSVLLMLGVGGVLGACRFVRSALSRHRPYDFEAETPDLNPDLGRDEDWWDFGDDD